MNQIKSIKIRIAYWTLIFLYLALPIFISVVAETEKNLITQLTYNAISLFGFMLPFALFPKQHKWLQKEHKIPSIKGLKSQHPINQEAKFINNDKKFIKIKKRDSRYDEDLIPFVKKALQDSSLKKIIFVHIQGSHTPYRHRFPPNFNIFKENNQNYFTREFDDYDNSIRHTDYVLSEIIKEISPRQEPSFVLYFSDHGDDVRLDEDSCHCHSSNPEKQTIHMFEIPFLLWMNKAYKKANTSLISALPEYVNRPFVNHHLIHSLPTLTGLSFDLQDNTKNLFSNKFIPEQP